MTPTTILDARRDPELLGTSFPGPTWPLHDVILLAGFGLPMSDAEREAFRGLAHREPPPGQVHELWLLCGRRSGKTQLASLIVVYVAAFCRWRVTHGEVPTVLLLAADREQAAVAFRRVVGMLEASPVLSQEVANVTADRITLRNGVEIQVGTSDYRSVRGRTLVCVVCDEICHWRSERTVNPDSEILAAVRPALATMPGSMLVAISSPYSQRGVAFDAFRKYHGTDDPRVLVIRAASRVLNPTIPQHVVDDAIERDPQAAAAEWLAEWRSDLETFLDAALVDQAARTQPRELPCMPTRADGTARTYLAGVDVSGGRGDAAACAIAHREGDRVVVDAVRRWPAPHDPAVVAAQVRDFLASYGLRAACADQYGAELSRSIYRSVGVELLPSEWDRSTIYLRSLSLFTRGVLELPDDPVLRRELLGLERRTGRIRDVIDHPPGAGSHDDVANSAMLAACLVDARASRRVLSPDDFWVLPCEALDGYHDGGPTRPAFPMILNPRRA